MTASLEPRLLRRRSADRIGADVDALAGPAYTRSTTAICRYAYTPQYAATLDYFRHEFERLEFVVTEDPVGNLVARNRPTGEPVFGIGSHCDSNRNGGKYDGTLGVAVALEVCRLNVELGRDLPLQVISFLEEEGSGFGQMLLGSRIVARRVSERELRETFRSIDDGRSFWEHAEAAGHEPARWRECSSMLDDMTGWIELHIEQGRVLQDTNKRVGIVRAIAGYVHGDVAVAGRADHAGATPMTIRLDAGLIAAETIVELERLALAAGHGTVGTVGELAFEPNLINVIPGSARFSIDVRSANAAACASVVDDLVTFVAEAARRRGGAASFVERQALAATTMDARIVAALEEAGRATGEPFATMVSGAAHDTMCVADRVPTAMVFVPCVDGVSHSPLERTDVADAALGAEIILNAMATLRSAAADTEEER
jgi:hydantoinase/carbamoylase family amidase